MHTVPTHSVPEHYYREVSFRPEEILTPTSFPHPCIVVRIVGANLFLPTSNVASLVSPHLILPSLCSPPPTKREQGLSQLQVIGVAPEACVWASRREDLHVDYRKWE